MSWHYYCSLWAHCRIRKHWDHATPYKVTFVLYHFHLQFRLWQVKGVMQSILSHCLQRTERAQIELIGTSRKIIHKNPKPKKPNKQIHKTPTNQPSKKSGCFFFNSTGRNTMVWQNMEINFLTIFLLHNYFVPAKAELQHSYWKLLERDLKRAEEP